MSRGPRDASPESAALSALRWPVPVAAAVLEELPTAVVAADRRGRVRFANRAARALLGATLAQEGGGHLLRLFGGPPALAHAFSGLEVGQEQRLEFPLARPQGPARDLGLTLLRVARGTLGDGVEYVLVFRDLDQRRQFELEQRRLERQSAIRTMVGGFAHELRNPLAGIQALAEAYLAECPAEDTRREYVERMLPLLARIGRFVSASLRFGEPERPERRRQAPVQLLQAASDALSPRWLALGAAPRLVSRPGLPDVLVDPPQVIEALVELIENALDAVGDPRRVCLALAVQRPDGDAPGHVRLEVRDDGPGISASDLCHVFDPFFTTKPKATGLGLSVAQTLVRENGGRLLARSTPGFETVFAIVLPEAP